ncbi:MAG: YcxB family protein [Verrucomicrobiales bacterium]
MTPQSSSLTSPIKITTRFDEETLKKGSAAHFRYRHPWFLRFRYFYLIGLSLLGLFLLSRGDVPFGTVCLFLAPILFLRKFLWQYRALANVRSSPHFGQDLHWTITPEEISQKAENLESSFGWDSLYETHASEDLILLYPQKNIYYTLLRRDFASEADFARLRDFINAKRPAQS